MMVRKNCVLIGLGRLGGVITLVAVAVATMLIESSGVAIAQDPPVNGCHIYGELPNSVYSEQVNPVRQHTNCPGWNFQGADLSKRILVFAQFHGADFTGANLAGANLNGARVNSAKMNGADLRFANLVAGKFVRTDFTGADMKGVQMRRADLTLSTLMPQNDQVLVVPPGETTASYEQIDLPKNFPHQDLSFLGCGDPENRPNHRLSVGVHEVVCGVQTIPEGEPATGRLTVRVVAAT
jgi:hypothetical protein